MEMCDEYHAVAFLIPGVREKCVVVSADRKRMRTRVHTSIIAVVGGFILRPNDGCLADLGHCELESGK